MYFVNRTYLVLGCALLSIIIGYFAADCTTTFFYSIGMIAIGGVMSYHWVTLVEYLNYGKPKKGDGVVLLKALLTALTQVAVIYYTLKEYPFLGAVSFGCCVYGWSKVTPHHHSGGGDAAGNAMAAGFQVIFDIAKSIIMGVVAFLLVVFVKEESFLYVVVFFIAMYLFGKVLGIYMRNGIHERPIDKYLNN